MGGREWGGVAALIAASVAAVFAAASCQTQEFYPVGPKAIAVGTTVVKVQGKPLPPNIMLVVDRSGSMTESVTGTGLACTVDGTVGATYDARSTNPCKWNDLKTAFADPTTGFLTTSNGLARFGLAAFPGGTAQCDTGSILVPIGDDVQPIREQLLNRLVPGGGTPSAATLREAAKDPALQAAEANRRRFAMLLTDGLPNCSSAYAARCDQCRADAASCSIDGGCHPTEHPGTCPATPFDGASCLDEEGLVSAVTALDAAGIGTIVIGFGKDTSGTDANRVLTAAAQAGGFPRQGADVAYYQANSGAELEAFLQEILSSFPCTFPLVGAPTSARLVQTSVLDNQKGTETFLSQGTDWRFPSASMEQVEILGGWCTTLQAADPDRYTLTVRFVNGM